MLKLKLIEDFSPRTYQESIFANSMNKNSLVVLPTGLGKTIIAIMLVAYVFNKFPNKKILFLAPTKPLVEQQKTSFESFFVNSKDFNFQVLTGQIQPRNRIKKYEESHFIFSTPQLIENDLINRRINPKDFSLVIFDEAHRAIGNYAYTFIAEEFNKSNIQFLALTASPASTMETIREVISNLKIEHVEVRKYEDPDVKEFVNETEVEYVEVELNDEFKLVKDKLNLVYKKRLELLKDYGFLRGKNISNLSKKDLLDFQLELRREVSNSNTTDKIWKAISITAALMKLLHGIELFESQEVIAAYNYFYEFFNEGKNKTKAVENLVLDIDFRDAFEGIIRLKKNNVKHPKLIKLKDIVLEELSRNRDLKIIIFSQYRESAIKIVEELSNIKELNPTLFIGQSRKGGVGISQKKQKQILDKFRDGEFNILISTSVGEEGLDIPKVDLVLFYEPVPSAIRTIQRSGRTGRFNRGKVVILITKDTRDVLMRYVARAKEKKMYSILDKIRDEFNEIENDFKLIENKNKKKDNNNSLNLNKFMGEGNLSNSDRSDKRNKNNRINDFSNNLDESDNVFNNNLPLIYVDNRENTDLIKELFKLPDLKVESKQLVVGDIVISDRIAIERKAKIDFVNSILDRRIFEQLKNLAMNFQRPILIIEGEEDIFSLRNLNPNVIRATLSTIAIDFRIPIIFTNSMEETAKMIQIITKRNHKSKKEISLNSSKISHGFREELEKVISSIPRINIITAKNLLEYFGSIKDLVNSTEEEIMKIEGIGKVRAKALIEFFNKKY